MSTTKQQAKWIRFYRWLHRKLAIALFVFFLLIAITGLLLGIKKQTGLLAPTQKGRSADLSTWLPINTLRLKADGYLQDSISQNLSKKLDRLDIRPDKGIVKLIYKDHYWGLQLDGSTGDLLSIEKRSSDFIEALHDGSIMDDLLGTSNEQIKVSYMVITGISFILLILSGLWLWYGPRKLRRQKRIQA